MFSLLDNRKFVLLVSGLLTGCLFVVYYVGVDLYRSQLIVKYNSLYKSFFEGQPVKSECGTKRILLWNSPWRIEVAAFGTGGPELFASAGCPVTDCSVEATDARFLELTKTNSSLLDPYDAVLVMMHELHLAYLPRQQRRPFRQRMVFLTQESPQSMSIDPARYDGYFNWTMSYRLNSDIRLLYGRFRVKGNDSAETAALPASPPTGRKKPVVWMASHCPTPSRREEYVARLGRYIAVDVYGRCGKLRCERNDSHWLSAPQCYTMLEKQYKFYLSFENSICTDYVTEKFFNILQHDMVPVVLGGAEYAKIAPPGSYIDALKFSGPRDLADYLHFLDSHDAEYLKYFEWKRWFTVESGVEQMARHAFCDLCAKLHQPNEPVKVYDSLVSEWSVEAQCR